ncbi:GYG1 [Lepeophtheirus salmonis]|uniref:glycogenin glucosyltransferase n=1 Tax=Lepeophtheirus salmonis TaxID=72036 RepID=A0A7R8H8R2_LEPSM|nr:GYG1 [Lepeophtheirus salmonis]CAF2927423.1 GYG1 [Lepeophtheirus salmonis]
MTEEIKNDGEEAWVTLATNETYAIGALVLAHSLKMVGTKKKLAVLVTKSLKSETMRTALKDTFDTVLCVEEMDSYDAVNLELLKRPELGITFTKLHCWCLIQYSKCVFLDADTFVMQFCDELFDREELSAAPDAGWPDCFNSGVFVFKPSLERFNSLVSFAKTEGSFDGGDQGLLNSYFDTWATKDIQKHLPFVYNMCATSTYTYLPAYKKFSDSVKIIHFIGMSKPWDARIEGSTGRHISRVEDSHANEHLEKWWSIYESHVKPIISHLNSLYVVTHPSSPILSSSISSSKEKGRNVDNSSSSQDVSLLGSFSTQNPSLAKDSSSSIQYFNAPQNVHIVEPPKDNRLSWEKGCPDYMGTASFDKILEKINTTLLEEKNENVNQGATKNLTEDEP